MPNGLHLKLIYALFPGLVFKEKREGKKMWLDVSNTSQRWLKGSSYTVDKDSKSSEWSRNIPDSLKQDCKQQYAVRNVVCELYPEFVFWARAGKKACHTWKGTI